MASFTPDLELVSSKDLSRWGVRKDETLHLLVDKKACKRRLPGCKLHYLSVPDGLASLFLEVEPGVCLVSPELTFLMSAQDKDLVDLAMLGFELCGCYAMPSSVECGLTMRPPLTCVERIRDIAESMPRLKGVSAARKALQYVIDGSGSPQETALVLLLCLPNKYGGFGMPWPEMNLRMNLSPSAAAVWGRSNAFDLVWREAKVVIEYDGREGHSSFEQAERDSTRRNALVVDGFTVFTITASQLRNVEGLHSIARVVARQVGYRLQFRDKNFWSRHLLLRSRVLGGFRVSGCTKSRLEES